ncbi:MAG: T9SS type A sorting domain-containing protein [Sphingobacteriia bacterium]|nr:T9SS type A sorting domain-containing protein [Sphingobacteriia bacterium]
MKHVFTLLMLSVFLSFYSNQQVFASKAQVISERLNQKIQTTKSDDLIRINIIMKENFDTEQLLRNVETMEREERRIYVIGVLKEFSALAQKRVRIKLNDLQQQSMVSEVRPLWIANVINCYATSQAILELSSDNEIELIDEDVYQILLDPAERKDAVAMQGNPDDREITWNVLKINAQLVWDLGYTGDGVIVAVIDTGVNYNHLDLQNNLWEHPDYPYHGWNYVSNNNNPLDDNGHGTHCAGTVAGNGTAGSQTGVAPGAKIMCLKALDSGGGGNQSSVWYAAEFSVEHGAHVISLSLGWQHSWGPNRQVFRQTFDNVLAAGLVASVAAGNEGDQQNSFPIPDNVRTPGDCPPPWLHPDQTLVGGISSVICIGATDNNDGLADFSGRGPATWATVSPFNDYPYQPGIGLIRPDISSPGVNIKSLAHYNNTGYEANWSGTSMATPAAAGVMALMLQKNNSLTPAQISQILEETTVVLQPGKNNNSGSGRVNALAAVNAVSMPGPSYYSHTFNDLSGNGNGEIDPAESILLTLSMANFSDEVIENVTVSLSCDSDYITLTDTVEFYGNFELESIIEMEDAFAFEVDDNIPGGETLKFYLMAVSGEESWESSFTATANGVAFATGLFTISDPNGNGNGSLDPGENVLINIEIINNGQIAAPEVICNLTSSSPEITINNGSFTIPVLNGGESANAAFNITVAPGAQIGAVATLNLGLTSGFYLFETSFYPKIGLIVEDFETGDFSQFNWDFAGSAPWSVVSTGAYEGTYAAKSGTIGNNATSEINITIEVAGNDSIAFYRKVSSEADYDFLQFYIDDLKMDEWSGETEWGRVAYPVTSGSKIFRWVYSKDVFVTSGSDCGWIDYIELPVAADQTMSVNAGADAEICEGVDFQTTATAQNFSSLIWTTSGTGSFDNNTMLNAIYTPGQEDYAAGNVELLLTVFDSGGDNLSDNLLLSFLPLPEIPGNITGPNVVCMGFSEYFSTNGSEHAVYYQWELIPETAGTFNSADTTVLITFTDGFTGTAALKVKGINDCGEGEFSAEFPIQVDDCTGLADFDTSSKISLTPNPNNGVFFITFADDFEVTSIIKIFDPQGQIVYVQRTSDTQHEINLGTLRNGVYFLLIENEFFTSTNKLVINK